MIDALLHSYRDAIINAGFGYGKDQVAIMDDAMPRANCGDYFIAVYPGPSRSTNDNCLYEFFDFGVCLTMRLKGIPKDRIGDKLLAVKLAKESGFNRRAEQLRAFLHMDWGVLQDANNYLVQMHPDANQVYGFCEPARYRGMETPVLVGPEWFGCETPESATEADQGLKATLAFADAKRFQAIANYV